MCLCWTSIIGSFPSVEEHTQSFLLFSPSPTHTLISIPSGISHCASRPSLPSFSLQSVGTVELQGRQASRSTSIPNLHGVHPKPKSRTNHLIPQEPHLIPNSHSYIDWFVRLPFLKSIHLVALAFRLVLSTARSNDLHTTTRTQTPESIFEHAPPQPTSHEPSTIIYSFFVVTDNFLLVSFGGSDRPSSSSMLPTYSLPPITPITPKLHQELFADHLP